MKNVHKKRSGDLLLSLADSNVDKADKFDILVEMRERLNKYKDNSIVRFKLQDRLSWLRKASVCVFCGYKGEHNTIDHIKPSSKGGSNESDNLQVLCNNCNQMKSDKYPYTKKHWLAEKRKLEKSNGKETTSKKSK